MTKGRVTCWFLSILLAFLFFGGEKVYGNITAEKTPIYIYAPQNMESSFKRALKDAGLKKTHEIIMTEDAAKANVEVATDKEFDNKYTKIAYSPFVVLYSSEEGNIKDMTKSGLLKSNLVNDNYKEIDFNMLIEEALGEGNLEKFGIKNKGVLKIYYPAPGTKYYTDYYNFMLVTVNNGVYPQNEEELKKAVEIITLFEKSQYTEAVKDFIERVDRAGVFMENTFYLVPEQEAYALAQYKKVNGRLFYPLATVYANYYVKADETGSKLVDAFNAESTFGNFYSNLETVNYRSDYYGVLNEMSSYLYDERDVYNVIHLEEDRVRIESLTESKE